MSWRARLIVVVLVALACARVPLAQSPASIKLATVVPDGSVWDKSLSRWAPTGRRPPRTASR